MAADADAAIPRSKHRWVVVLGVMWCFAPLLIYRCLSDVWTVPGHMSTYGLGYYFLAASLFLGLFLQVLGLAALQCQWSRRRLQRDTPRRAPEVPWISDMLDGLRWAICVLPVALLAWFLGGLVAWSLSLNREAWPWIVLPTLFGALLLGPFFAVIPANQDPLRRGTPWREAALRATKDRWTRAIATTFVLAMAFLWAGWGVFALGIGFEANPHLGPWRIYGTIVAGVIVEAFIALLWAHLALRTYIRSKPAPVAPVFD